MQNPPERGTYTFFRSRERGKIELGTMTDSRTQPLGVKPLVGVLCYSCGWSNECAPFKIQVKVKRTVCERPRVMQNFALPFFPCSLNTQF